MTQKKDKNKKKKNAEVTEMEEDRDFYLPREEEPVNPVGNALHVFRGDNSRIWLISFTDIFALMLTFFVMLFSMSNPKLEAWTNIVTALDAENNTKYGARHNPGPHSNQEMSRTIQDKAEDIGYLAAILNDKIEGLDKLGETHVKTFADKMVISLPNDLLFAPGRADLSEDARKSLHELSGVFRNLRNKVEVYGHTDPNPVKTAAHNSNWGLSLARASNVAAFLQDSGYQRDVIVIGLADNMFKREAVPTQDQETQYRRARRVDVIIHEYKTDNPWK